MCKAEKTELIVNCVLGILSIAFAVFIFDYENYAMTQYAKTLPQEAPMGYWVVGIIMMVFLYLPLACGAGILALSLFGLTWKMYRADGKVQSDFIADKKTKAVKIKNRCLITLIILKSLATAGALLLVYMSFASAHDTALSKTVYCVAFAVYAASLVLTIVNRKKITAQTANQLHTENNL
ncbi:MAG: hypothetical protein IJX96_04675 [Clostridia bacterium]|nr:hypothetical protein [Clostridia bacterium]